MTETWDAGRAVKLPAIWPLRCFSNSLCSDCTISRRCIVKSDCSAVCTSAHEREKAGGWAMHG